MSAFAERVLYGHVTNPESLRFILKETVAEEILPTPELKPVMAWAIDYFMASGLTKAPSVAVLRDEFEDVLDDHEIDLEDEPEETVEWAVDKLKATYAFRQSQEFVREFASAMADEDLHSGRVELLGQYAGRLTALSNTLESGVYRVEARDGFAESLRNYEARAESRSEIRGMRFGLPAVDAHTHGIHEGELAVLAAPPKTGKSYFVDHVALAEWRAGRRVALVTLENSIEMTYDRIACLANGVDPSAWQRGLCPPSEVEVVRDWVADIQRGDLPPLWVMQPPLGRQNFDSMVAEAMVRGADSLIIDQLTFVEMDASGHKPKTERIGENLHRLKKMISQGRHPLACLLAHQINREGVRQADKVGYLEMHHLADSAEVERTADWVFGMYASRDMQKAHRLTFQTLASRREVTKNWSLIWEIRTGTIASDREITLGN